MSRKHARTGRLKEPKLEPDDLETMTVAELVTLYAEERSSYAADSGRTIRSTMKAIVSYFHAKPMRQMTTADLEAFMSMRLEAGASPATVRGQANIILAALRLAIGQGWRQAFVKPVLPRVPAYEGRALTPEEAQALYQAAEHPACARFIAIALATGARSSAITDLTWDRVDVRRRTIDFRAPIFRADRRKNRPIVAVTDELLTIIGARAAGLTGPVIGTSPQYIYCLVRAAARKAGLGNDVTPHALRRTAATTLVRSLSMADAQRMLGHRMPKVTDSHYVKLDTNDLRRAVEANAPLIRALSELDPPFGPVQPSRSPFVLHITDKDTDRAIRGLAQHTGWPAREVLRLACVELLRCLGGEETS